MLRLIKVLSGFTNFLLATLSFTLFVSCNDSDEGPTVVRYSGRIIYREGELPVKGLPIHITVYKVSRVILMPGVIINSDPRIYFASTATSEDGSYFFDVPADSLPGADYRYSIGLEVDSLLVKNDNVGDCVYGASFGLTEREQTIRVASPTWLQITYNKLDHQDSNFIRGGACIHGYQTTLAIPDSTFVELLAFRSSQPRQVSYNVIDEMGNQMQFWTEEFTLQKGDTTKLYIEY